MIVLENERIRLEFGEEDGVIRGLADLGRKLAYIGGQAGGDPFRLETDEGTGCAVASFDWRAERFESGGQQANLTWRTPEGVTVRARIDLAPGAGELTFRCSAENNSAVRLLESWNTRCFPASARSPPKGGTTISPIRSRPG